MTANQQSDASPIPFVQAWLQAADPSQRIEFLHAHHSEITDETILSMKAAVSERLRQDPRDALDLAESILMAATLSGEPMHQAWGLMARGNAQRYLAQYEEAMASYDLAKSICLAQGNPVEAARPQMAKVHALTNLGQLEEALQNADEARRVFEAHGEATAAAIVDYQAGITAYKLGDYNRSLALFDQARQRFEQSGAKDLPDYIYVELNRSVALRNLDRFAEAESAASQARRMARQKDMKIVVARSDQSLAITYYFLGRYNEALRLFNRARDIFESSGLEREVLVANLFATNCHLALNRYAAALDLAGEAEEKLARLGMHYEIAWAAYSCAQAHMGLGDLEAAADALATARLGFAQIKNQVWMATVDTQWAVLNTKIGAFEAALTNARRAADVFAGTGLVVEEAQANLVAAEIMANLEQDDESRRLCLDALEAANTRDVPWLANQAQHLLGGLAEIAGDKEVALDHYEACASGIERLRGQIAIELRGGFLADKGEIYEDLVSLRLARAETARALTTVERAKSRALVELLANNLDIRVKIRNESDRDLVAHIERLRQECQWYYNRFDPFGEWEGAESGRPQGEQDRLREELKRREKQLADMLLHIQIRNAEYTQDVDLWRVRVESPQPFLESDTLLVEYFIARGEVLAFSVTQDDLQVHRRLATASQLSRMLSLLHLNLFRLSPALLAEGSPLDHEWANLRGLLGHLYEALLLPLNNRLARFERLIVVPHGPLHYLPFHALYDGGEHLVERFEISYLPNSSMLRLRGDSKATGCDVFSSLIVGCSFDGALPHVLTEAELVARRLSGPSLLEDEATRAGLEARARDARVIHLATHGEFRPEAPLFSTLHLADGPLTATDVFNLELDASLVTLSACQSGASAVGGGDELVGFSRAFLYAGAASLLMSLWRVDDQATAHLMDRFYQGLLDGQRKPAALRQAQISLLGGEVGGQYRHPYFWAPFFLVGERGQII
jgi:tetratricopeptide (TPR) repeat protein